MTRTLSEVIHGIAEQLFSDETEQKRAERVINTDLQRWLRQYETVTVRKRTFYEFEEGRGL
jgi:hypothetical protein